MEECDPNVERSSHVRTFVERDTACYRLLYPDKNATVEVSTDQAS